MADFGGNDEQDIKINIDVVGADESASKLDRLADSLDSMASPEALAAQTAAQIAAAEKVAAEERRIAEAAAAERKAAREREAAEMARLTAQYDADREKRAAALAAAREAALKRQQEQEALAASVGVAAIQDRLKALKELEAESERVKQVEEENNRLIESRREALDALLAKQRLLSEEIGASDKARREAAAEAGDLQRILQRQIETELKPYSGDLISPEAIADAERQLKELQDKIKTLREPIDSAREAIDSAPRRSRAELKDGKVERAEQVRLPSPTGDYSKEDRAARESFIASVKALIGDKTKQFDTSDPAKLFQQLEELIKKANAVGPGNFSGIQQAEATASDSNFKVVQLTESLKALQGRQAEVLDRVVAGPPKGAAPKSAEAKEFADIVAQAGSIAKEIAALESAINAERSRGDEARSLSKGAKEAFNAKSLGVTADQMPKLLELLSKIRSNLELKEQITAKAPTVWMDESDARRGLPSTKELDDAIRRATDLEAELSRARGKSGEYKTPIRTGDREVTSGPRESDPEGRSDAQLREAIAKAKEREGTSAQFQAGFIDSKAEIDKAVKEAEAAVVIAFRESRRRMAEAIGPMVDSIDLDEIFSGLLKDLADRMVEKFKASGKRTAEEVEKFREQILSTGENPLAAKDSFTKSGQQRRGAPVIRTMPGDPEPEIPMVGAARTALGGIIRELMKSSPLLRGVSSVQGDRDRDQEVEARQAQLRVQATAAKRIPAQLTNIGRISQSVGADKSLVSDLEAELTVLDGIEEKTEAQVIRFKAIKDQLEEIKNSAVALSASGDILGILAALGVSPDSNIGATGRGVAGIASPFQGSVVSSLFKPRSKYFDESETDPRSEGLGSPMGTMLRVKREKTGERGIELQTVTAEGEDLLEALETVEQTSIGITAIFAKITDNMRGGKQNDPALLTALTDQVIGLLSILNEMKDLDVDTSLPAKTQEKFNALKDIVDKLLSPGGGVRETMVALSQGALTNASMNSIIGKSPDERKAVSGDLAKYVLTPLLPNLDALTEAVKTLVDTPSKKTAGSGQAQIPGVPFGQPGAVGDINVIKGIVDTIATGDGEKIRAVIAEAIARNVFDADKLRSMIPGETGAGVAPRSEELKGLSAVEGKFDLGSADSRLKFADIIAGVPSIMEILGNYPTLASLLIEDGGDGSVALLEALAAEEEEAKAQIAAIAKRVQAFKKAVPMLATPRTLSDVASTVFEYSDAPRPNMSGLRRVTDASTLSEEQARTITPLSIPPHLVGEYRGAGRRDARGDVARTATGFGQDDSVGLTADQARQVAQDVIDFLRSKGLSVSTIDKEQTPGFAPLEDVAKGATGAIPDKTTITVIHKGDSVADDLPVFTGLVEALRTVATTPSVNRGMTIASYPSTDVDMPGGTRGAGSPSGYSYTTAGVERPGGVAETYSAIQLAEQMRLRPGGPLIPVPNPGAVASHETRHMAVIGGREEAIFQDKDVMLPVHRAILSMMEKMANAISDPSKQIPDEIRANMEAVVIDFFENIPPMAIQQAAMTGSEEELNRWIAEYIANGLAQMSGYKSGGGRPISHGDTGVFSEETIDFLGQMFGPRGPSGQGSYSYEARPGAESFGLETPESMQKAVEEFGGLTRKIILDAQGNLRISTEAPKDGFAVGGEQLKNPASGFLNFKKSDVTAPADLAEGLTALLMENEQEIKAKILKGTDVWLGMFNQKVRGADGRYAKGTAFDLTTLLPLDQEEEAIRLGKERGQDSIGAFSGGEWDDSRFRKLRDPKDVQRVTMLRGQGGGFTRRPGTTSANMGPDTVYGFGDDFDESFKKVSRQESLGGFTGEDQDELAQIDRALKTSSEKIQSLQKQIDAIYDSIDSGDGSVESEGALRETAEGLDAQIDDLLASEEKLYDRRHELREKERVAADKEDERQYALVRESLEGAIVGKGSSIADFVGSKGADAAGIAGASRIGGGITRTSDALSAGIPQEIIDYALSLQNQRGGLQSDGQVIDDRVVDQILIEALARIMPELESGEMPQKENEDGSTSLLPIERIKRNVLLMQARLKADRGQIYGFSGGPEDPANLDFDFSDLVDEEDDGSIQEDSSDTYAPVEEEKPKPKRERKPRKKKEPVGADPRSTLVTPREAEVAQAEELGVSTEELAIITPEQTERLIKRKQAKDMAENAARDEERLKTAGSRAEAARKRAIKRDPRARLETPMEAQIDEGAEVGLSPDEAARVDPSVIAKRKRDADEAKIAELNAADAARRAKVEQERFAREKAIRDAEEAAEKVAADKRAAAAAARQKAAEEEAKKADEEAKAAEEASKPAETSKAPAEPTKEEFEAQTAEDNAARKARVAAQRKARAAARKAAKAEEAAAAATEQSAEASDAVARAETESAASKTEAAQEIASPESGAPVTLRSAGTPPTPPRPPAPPTPPAGDGQQPDDNSRIDAEVNAAIERLGAGSKLPALEAIVAKIAEEVEKMVNARMEEGAKVGISYDRDALKSSIIESNIGGFKDILVYLDGIAAQGEKLRSQNAMPIMGEGATAGTPAAVAERIGNASWLPDGLKRQDLIKMAEDFDKLGQDVALLIDMSRQGKLKIEQEIQSAKASAGSGGGSIGGDGGGADPGKSPMQWGSSGVATPDLVNIFKGEKDLRNLANVFRELRPQVAHVGDNIDEVAKNLQKQNRAAQDTTRALSAYMNVNTGILKSLKTQVGRAATFLFVQQVGREIAGVVEHLQSGVFKFNQVLENTQVGFNTLFANTLQASSSARNELVPAYNAVGAQVGFVKEQALTFNEALALTSNAASNMVNKIRDIANVTPFRFQPLVEASLKMKAFGFEAVEIPGMINSISNAVAALGGEDEKIDRIAYALGQMNSAGRVYQNDMMQLANAGIAGYRMLSDKMLTDLVALKKYTMGELKDLPDYVIDEMKRLQSAISTASFEKSFGSIDTMINTLQDPRRAEGLIRQMAKRGFLLGSVAARAITEGMDKQYQGSADRLSRTMTGALSTIADLSQNFMATAFQPIFNSVRDTIVELGQFMLKSQEITEFVLRVKDNVKGFVDGLKNFGPVLENMAGIFINVFVGGIGAAMEKGSQFGDILGNIVQKLSAGFSLVGDILNDKVGRGLATAATLGTVFVKAIMANPMIATITLIAVAISGIAEAIKTNFLGIGTVMAIFMDSIKHIIQVITEAMATIAKDIGTSAISSFVAGLTAAIVILTPFLQVLLHTFAFFLKILTPFAPILGVLLGLFLAFKTATMLWNIATLALSKPIAAITSAWGGAAKAVNQYQEQIKLTAQMHADLQQKKIAAQDYVRGTDGQPLKDKDGRPILNYDPATESVSSAGYPSQSAGEAAQTTVNAGTRVRGVLERIDERLPDRILGVQNPLKGLLVSPRERIMGAIKPDFGSGLTLSHNDSARPGHLSTVITTEKLENRFRSFMPGGELEGLGKQMSAANILNIPGLDKGEVKESANRYSTAWGENLKALILIEKEVSYVLSEAFRKMQEKAKAYKDAVASGDKDAQADILQQTVDSEEGRILLPMLTTAKYGKDKKHTDLTKDEISGLMGSFFDGGLSLTPEQMRNVESLPPEVQQLIYNTAAKRVASGDAKLTGGPGGEQEQVDTAVATGRTKAMIKGGSIGVIDGISKKITGFFDSLNKGTANLVKNIPILQKLQKINMGGAGTGMQQIQQTERGAYRYVNEDGSMGKYVGKEELANRRSMRFTPSGRFSRAFGMAGAMAGIASGASRMAGMGNQAYGIASTLMPGITDMLGDGFKQVMTQKAGFFQGLGNSVGTMLGAGFGSMIPIIGPILGPAIGGMIGELAGNIIDTATRASQASIDAKKRMIAANVALGLDEKTAKKAAEADLKIQAYEGRTGDFAGGIPLLVNDIADTTTESGKQTLEAFKKRINTKEILEQFDKNKNGIIDNGVELQGAIAQANADIAEEMNMGFADPSLMYLFGKDASGQYTDMSAEAVANRAEAKKRGYVEGGEAQARIGLTSDEIAALTARDLARSDIEAASMSETQFQQMFPGFGLDANSLADFNSTKVTTDAAGTVEGDRYRKVLIDAGISLETALNSPMLMQLLQSGSDMKTVVAQLQKNKDSGMKLDSASEKLLSYASLLEVQNLGSYRDENGNIRTEYQPGMARLLGYDNAQAVATGSVGEDGQAGTADDVLGKTFKQIFGFRQVAQGTGIGGGDTMYSEMFMEGLKAMGRIDPIEAMMEAGVIQSIDEMVGKSAAEIMEMWKKTGEYFEAFRKRAEELTPKVNLRSSRLELMEEFGKDKGYELYDQFEAERAKLATMDKEFAGLGGSRELERLKYFDELMGQTTTTRTEPGRRDNGSIIPNSGGVEVEQILPGLLTAAELGKLERMKQLSKEILDYEKQKFPIKIRSKAIDSTDEKVRAQAVRDEAALAQFRDKHKEALDAIQAKKAAGLALTRDQNELDKLETALRDKLIITATEEVDLGETLAILEKEGISISNKELINNDTLLAILAAKAKLQEASNTAGKGAVYWSNLEAKSKSVVTRLSEKQIDLELLKQELYRNTQGGIGMAMAAEAKFQKDNAKLIAETNALLALQEGYTRELANNPYAFNKAELDRINALLARAPGSMIDAAGASADAAAIQRNTSLLNTMANVAQKSYERIRKAQQKTHDEYIEQLNEQQQAIEERYRKRGDEQQEQSLLQQLQLAGLAMRSESADPLEAAKSFYEAKNNLAEFYIEKQKNDEVKAIEDEKERYEKQFKENTEAQEAIYGASMERMKNRFEAVNRVLGEEAIDPADLKNLLLLTMSGKVPTITSNYDKTMAALFEQVDKQVAEGKQELALGEGLGTISIGTLTPDGKAYTANQNLVDGNLDSNIKSKYGFDKIYKGSNEESGLLATFMNEILAAGVSFTDSGETYTGAAALEYLKKIKPSRGFEMGAAAGKEEQGRERQGLFEYLTSLLSTTNTFDSSQKLAILAQRTLEQSISDFEKATKVDVNMAGLLEADIANKLFEDFIKSMGQTPDEAKIKELKELVRDTYTDVLAAMDAREYEKFASSADPRIGQLTNQVDQISDSITHLKDSLDGGLTNLDKLLFGTTYDSAAPIPGIDVATEQIDVITASILDMQTAFEGTMDSLEAYADSLEGPIGAFHQMVADIQSIAGLAGGITLPSAGTAAPTPSGAGSLRFGETPTPTTENPYGYRDGEMVNPYRDRPEGVFSPAVMGYWDDVLKTIVNQLPERLNQQEASTMPVPQIAEFNAELKAKLAEYAAAFASSVQTVGINGAQTTVTMYNQIPINITINDAQDMNTAELAAQVEEAVGRALRASGGSYINGTTS